jgi:putative transcriptional regulator
LSAENVFCFQGATAPDLYHYTECGLDDVWLRGGYEKVVTDEGEGVLVKHEDELLDVIGHFLVTAKKVLSGKEIRYLRKEMDLTQAELGQLVGLSDQQVARWEKEKSEIPSAADHLLRLLYLEHIGKTLKVRDLLTSLEETDSERADPQKVFAPLAEGGWEQRKAA